MRGSHPSATVVVAINVVAIDDDDDAQDGLRRPSHVITDIPRVSATPPSKGPSPLILSVGPNLRSRRALGWSPAGPGGTRGPLARLVGPGISPGPPPPPSVLVLAPVSACECERARGAPVGRRAAHVLLAQLPFLPASAARGRAGGAEGNWCGGGRGRGDEWGERPAAATPTRRWPRRGKTREKTRAEGWGRGKGGEGNGGEETSRT